MGKILGKLAFLVAVANPVLAAAAVPLRGMRLGADLVYLRFLDDRMVRVDFVEGGDVPNDPSPLVYKRQFDGPTHFEELGTVSARAHCTWNQTPSPGVYWSQKTRCLHAFVPIEPTRV